MYVFPTNNSANTDGTQASRSFSGEYIRHLRTRCWREEPLHYIRLATKSATTTREHLKGNSELLRNQNTRAHPISTSASLPCSSQAPMTADSLGSSGSPSVFISMGYSRAFDGTVHHLQAFLHQQNVSENLAPLLVTISAPAVPCACSPGHGPSPLEMCCLLLSGSSSTSKFSRVMYRLLHVYLVLHPRPSATRPCIANRTVTPSFGLFGAVVTQSFARKVPQTLSEAWRPLFVFESGLRFESGLGQRL